MADVFIDCEWLEGEYLTILGAYSYGQDRFQLYGDTLTRRRFLSFLDTCSKRREDLDTFLFCHGPDIGRIEGYFNLDLRQKYYCINTVTAFNRFTKFQNATLGHLEQYFNLRRKYVLSSTEITRLWRSGDRNAQRIVLDYNWEDCVNLRRLVRILYNVYNVKRSELKEIAMQ